MTEFNDTWVASLWILVLLVTVTIAYTVYSQRQDDILGYIPGEDARLYGKIALTVVAAVLIIPQFANLVARDFSCQDEDKDKKDRKFLCFNPMLHSVLIVVGIITAVLAYNLNLSAGENRVVYTSKVPPEMWDGFPN